MAKVSRFGRPRKNKSVVFYFATLDGLERQAFTLSDGTVVYLRGELHSCDCVEALDSAFCRDGEAVLNAVDLVKG